jgi:hypothetical protein
MALAWHRSAKGETLMRMTRIPGLAAIGAVFVLAAPAEPARALSLANPAAAAATQEDLHQGATQVHWHHGWHPGWHHGWHHRHW